MPKYDLLNFYIHGDYTGNLVALEKGAAGVLFRGGNYKKLATVMTKIADKKYDSVRIIKTATLNLDRFNPENIIVTQFLTLIKDNK